MAMSQALSEEEFHRMQVRTSAATYNLRILGHSLDAELISAARPGKRQIKWLLIWISVCHRANALASTGDSHEISGGGVGAMYPSSEGCVVLSLKSDVL